MYHANFPPSADFFCLAKRQYFSCGLLRVEQKGGHTMEMATDEPTPTASHQELSGSNTGHFTVTYDSEDANYCARVDELVRAIESMPFVNQLGQLGGERLGVRASLTCYAAREYRSCKCKRSNIVFVTQQRPTLLACLQDLSQQLQADRPRTDKIALMPRTLLHASRRQQQQLPDRRHVTKMQWLR